MPSAPGEPTDGSAVLLRHGLARSLADVPDRCRHLRRHLHRRDPRPVGDHGGLDPDLVHLFLGRERRALPDGRHLHGRGLRRLAHRDPAQHPRRALRHRYGARRLSHGAARRGRRGYRHHHRDVGARRLRRHLRAGGVRAGDLRLRVELPAARLHAARHPRHPAGRLALGREPGQGRGRRLPRAADRHRRSRPADRRGALHLRHHRSLERHLLRRGDDRPLRGVRGAGPAAQHRHAGDQAEDRQDHAVVRRGEEVPVAVAADLDYRRDHRRAARRRRRHRGADGLRLRQAHRAQSRGAVRQGRAGGAGAHRRPRTTRRWAARSSRC